MSTLAQLGLFSAKMFIVLAFILIILVAFFALIAKAKATPDGQMRIKNLSDELNETADTLLSEVLPKKEYKAHLKEQKAKAKKAAKSDKRGKTVFVLNFKGDIQASTVNQLTDSITAIINAATTHDEVVLRLESPGGAITGYGLAAAQLQRLRDHKIPLTVAVDKVAASGGYMMACIANKILAAPFAIVGSIGVVMQTPNFHRYLKDKHIDFELFTAGEYKRTVTMFGENTDKGREHLQQDIDTMHNQFKSLINRHRPNMDIDRVSKGEYWLAEVAAEMNLVDEIKTSDEYLSELNKSATLFEITHNVKSPLMKRIMSSAQSLLRTHRDVNEDVQAI